MLIVGRVLEDLNSSDANTGEIAIMREFRADSLKMHFELFKHIFF